MTLKLTPTTNDLKRDSGNSAVPEWSPANNGQMHIVEAHEPLKSGDGINTPFMGVPLSALQGGPPVQLSYTGDFNVIPTPQPAVEAKPEAIPLKIAIIGTAPSSRGLAPFNDPTWKIWACSAGNMQMVPRVDCWFEVHSNLLWPENESFGRPYIEWLNKQTFPIYMQDQALVPRAMTFPKDELVAEFGRYFFTSSFAWMMAFAIKQGAQEIGLWGVDMASRDEYILQRSGGHYFIQEALKRGIKVTLPNESDLIQPPPLYGFDDSTRYLRKLMVRKKELTDRLNAMRPQRDQIASSIVYLEGALEDIDYVISIWGGAQSHPG